MSRDGHADRARVPMHARRHMTFHRCVRAPSPNLFLFSFSSPNVITLALCASYLFFWERKNKESRDPVVSRELARFHILRYPPPLPPSRSSFLRPLSAKKRNDAARRCFDRGLIAYRDTKDLQQVPVYVGREIFRSPSSTNSSFLSLLLFLFLGSGTLKTLAKFLRNASDFDSPKTYV